MSKQSIRTGTRSGSPSPGSDHAAPAAERAAAAASGAGGVAQRARRSRQLQASLGNRRTPELLRREDARGRDPVQHDLRPNQTGLPDHIKSSLERTSGHSLDDVRVHFNSSKPAKIMAHAYAQGSRIYIAPGQERHLPHEAMHVIQQKQGRVKANFDLPGVKLNHDPALEREASQAHASSSADFVREPARLRSEGAGDDVVQCAFYEWAGEGREPIYHWYPVGLVSLLWKEKKKPDGTQEFYKGTGVWEKNDIWTIAPRVEALREEVRDLERQGAEMADIYGRLGQLNLVQDRQGRQIGVLHAFMASAETAAAAFAETFERLNKKYLPLSIAMGIVTAVGVAALEHYLPGLPRIVKMIVETGGLLYGLGTTVVLMRTAVNPMITRALGLVAGAFWLDQLYLIAQDFFDGTLFNTVHFAAIPFMAFIVHGLVAFCKMVVGRYEQYKRDNPDGNVPLAAREGQP